MATVNSVQDSIVMGDLMGTAEVAALLGLSKGRITQLLHEGRMPAPVANLKATPVWEGEAIRQFARILCLLVHHPRGGQGGLRAGHGPGRQVRSTSPAHGSPPGRGQGRRGCRAPVRQRVPGASLRDRPGVELTVANEMSDLRDRCERALVDLEVLRNKAAAGHAEYEHARLAGKIEGVKLALSYMPTPYDRGEYGRVI